MANDLELAEAALVKWRKNLHVTDPHKLDVGAGTCSFCKEYIDDDCKDCPVRRHTGKSGCNGTPYDRVCVMKEAWADDIFTPREEVMVAVQAEVDFLTMIRDQLKVKQERAA